TRRSPMSAMTPAIQKRNKKDGNLIASHMFAEMFHTYLECGDEVQAAIRDMVAVVNAPDATKEECDAALASIAEALLPSKPDGELGVCLEAYEKGASPDVKAVLEQMDREEATFADRLGALMEAKGMTQSDLAAAIGVGQPAISMMLARNCRPQRR